MIGEWNDLLKPLVFTTYVELITLQFALPELKENFTNSSSLMIAAVTIATIAVIVLFLISQCQFIQGIATKF